jgi:formate hydrogenlyase subunit 6/NADH:ubiquinone oxidoreductase subunit I
MARIRLNNEYRNKIANRIKIHLQQEDTQEKRKYDNMKAEQVDINDQAWNVAEKIVRRHYTDEDVEKAYYLQNKFENVSTIAKDSCFHFHYLGTKEKRNYDNEVVGVEENVPIEKHFDFRLNGSIDTESNYSSNNDSEYAFALFRDEINAQEDCNADILIEQADKDDNPHKRKFVENNEKYLGLSGGRNNETKYGREWNEKYQLDLIGRDYCRDRSIACEKSEFDFLISWKKQKANFVMAHAKWIESILKQMKEIKLGLKGYKWLDEGIELANELGLDVKDHEIIRTNSSGLIIYNPKNLAERIKGMKNTEKTREQKIAERVAYMQQQQKNSDNLN